MSKNKQKVAKESTQIKVDLNTKVDLCIDVDGVVTEIKPKDEKGGYGIKEIYEMCNTDIIEFIYLPEDKILIVDEEGALKKGKKINWDATKLVAPLILAQDRNPFFIFGNVILIDRKNVR